MPGTAQIPPISALVRQGAQTSVSGRQDLSLHLLWMFPPGRSSDPATNLLCDPKPASLPLWAPRSLPIHRGAGVHQWFSSLSAGSSQVLARVLGTQEEDTG